MYPLVLRNYASRILGALAAVASLLAVPGCGSGSGLVLSLPGNFSNASLNGQYVISQTGIALQSTSSAAPFSETIVFTANGSGKMAVGVDDFNQGGTLFEDTNLSGQYNISKDGTGSVSVNVNGTPVHYGITMIDDSHFYISQQDFVATSSGFGEKQDTTVFGAPPAGTFAFKAHTLNSSSRVGGVTIASGAISGTQDLLLLGGLPSSLAITSSVPMSTPDANGRGSFALSDGTSLFYYVVNSSKIYFLSNTGSLEIGQAEIAQFAGNMLELGTWDEALRPA